MATIAIDTETHRFAPGNHAPRVVCLTYCRPGESPVLLVGDDIPALVQDALTDPDVTVIGQNTQYDAAALSATFPQLMPLWWVAYEAGRVQCTRLREQLLDIGRGDRRAERGRYSLDRLARLYTDTVLDKGNPWRVRFGELEGLPVDRWPPEAVSYALEDAVVPLEVYQGQAKEALTTGYTAPAFEQEAARQAAYGFALQLMKVWGVTVDPAATGKLKAETTATLETLGEALHKDGLMYGGSKKMAPIRERVEAFFLGAGRQIPRTNTGRVSTAAETLGQCHDPALERLVQYSATEKMGSTFVVKLVQATIDGGLHADFNTLGADTGRTSCSNPNLQQQPREGGVRECFKPRPGFVFLNADYDTQELRTLAQALLDLVGWSKLAEKFQADPAFDPHSDFAAQILGVPLEVFKLRPDWKEHRQRAKAANFGFPGGMGARAFRSYARGYGVVLTEAEATVLRDQWFEQWPEMRAYFKLVGTLADMGTVTQLRSGRIRGGLHFTSTANTFFQGLASEASKTATFRVSRACYVERSSPLYGCRPLMLIHDELLVEAPRAYAHEAAIEMAALMVKAMATWCPDVPARVTPLVTERWSKSAAPLWAEGRLIPWDV